MAETKKLKQVCKCENCGNEAEMVITCTLEEEGEEQKSSSPSAPKKVKGTGTCTNCGNEADMWVDI
ncbi:MAG: hypothetical protein V2I97_12475 [Desulfococcaceae bacterium]|jgi:hypothetical protein|nr:hypothetical protein [Desulfococcaceae bacterium]